MSRRGFDGAIKAWRRKVYEFSADKYVVLTTWILLNDMILLEGYSDCQGAFDFSEIIKIFEAGSSLCQKQSISFMSWRNRRGLPSHILGVRVWV
jgi:hypothetical protein